MMENYAGRRMDHYLLRGRFGRRWRGSRVWADDEMGRQRDLAATYKLTGSVARRRVRSEGWRLSGADGEYSFAREARELGAGAYGVGSGVIGDGCGGSGRRDGRLMTGWRSWTCGR